MSLNCENIPIGKICFLQINRGYQGIMVQDINKLHIIKKKSFKFLLKCKQIRLKPFPKRLKLAYEKRERYSMYLF